LVSHSPILFTFLFSFTHPATTHLYTLSLHDALPISAINLTCLDVDSDRLLRVRENLDRLGVNADTVEGDAGDTATWWDGHHLQRSEEHTSELQSLRHLVCRLLLEKKKKKYKTIENEY